MRRVAFLLALTPSLVFAEGTRQIGANQDINEATVFKVDVLTAGEVINIAVGNNSKDAADAVIATVTDPSGAAVARSPFTIEPGSAGFLRLAGEMPPSPVPNPLQITTTVAGAYTVKFENSQGAWIDPLDITVTPNAGTPVVPEAPPGDFGRVHSRQWIITGDSFTSGTSSSYYVLVPTGPSTDFTWLLQINGIAGYRYDILANSTGVPAPYSGKSVPKSAVSAPTGAFEIYLHVPEVAKGNTAAPVVTNFGHAGQCAQSIVPGNDTTFTFTSSTAGTYLLVVDLDKDGTYDPSKGDIVLTGAAVVGANPVVWDGKDGSGAAVPAGTYQARVSVRLGEFHFVADDRISAGSFIDF